MVLCKQVCCIGLDNEYGGDVKILLLKYNTMSFSHKQPYITCKVENKRALKQYDAATDLQNDAATDLQNSDIIQHNTNNH